MTAIEIDLGQGQVGFDHLHGGVAEDLLEGVGIAAVTQVADGKGMPETMGVNVADTSAPAGSVEQLKQVGTQERAAVAGNEEGTIDRLVFTGDQVVEYGLASAGGEGDQAFFVALAKGDQVAVAKINILDL